MILFKIMINFIEEIKFIKLRNKTLIKMTQVKEIIAREWSDVSCKEIGLDSEQRRVLQRYKLYKGNYASARQRPH